MASKIRLAYSLASSCCMVRGGSDLCPRMVLEDLLFVHISVIVMLACSAFCGSE